MTLRSHLIGHWVLSLATLALLFAGCSSDDNSADDDLGDDIHPRTLFDKRVEPQLVGSCSCHTVAQGSVQPFLVPGMEYDSITNYKGGIFLTSPAVQSLLLQKGMHVGPALTAKQFEYVQSWIEAEMALRPSTGSMSKSGLLPTVPLQDGDFNMSFEDLAPILDAQANLTFTLKEDENRIYRVSQLKLTAGPSTGIHIKHPIFYFISAQGSFPDPADSLVSVDMQVAASKSGTLGSGGVLLTQAPINRYARIGVAFEVLERYDMGGSMDEMCKAFNLFNPAVKDQLTPCAASCHSPGKNNVANGAFDMEAAMSSDVATLQKFCLNALGRIDTSNPGGSILIKQITPQNLGGTPNHPFKQTDDGARMKFISAVQAWATAEK